MKKLLILIVLQLFLLSAFAQKPEVTTSEERVIPLDEIVVLSNGLDYSRYITGKLEKNIKPLKHHVSEYDCTVNATLGKQIDLSTLRKRRTIRFALSLLGWGKIFDIMMKYPDFGVTMLEDVHFQKGSIKNSKIKVVNTTPKLSDKELKAIMKKDWFLDRNHYDRFYDEVQKKIKSLKAKNAKYDIYYLGGYEENGHRIYILKYGHTQVDIVDGSWQIRRMKYRSDSRTITFDFQELSPGVFLPTSGKAEYNIDYDGYPKGVVTLSLDYSYKNIKAK